MSRPATNGDQDDGLRLDKWLWHSRFFKTRALAAQLAARGRVRVNRIPVGKSHFLVRPGDVLTFPQGKTIRVVRVLALPNRRGPAEEARGMYEDLEGDAHADREGLSRPLHRSPR